MMYEVESDDLGIGGDWGECIVVAESVEDACTIAATNRFNNDPSGDLLGNYYDFRARLVGTDKWYLFSVLGEATVDWHAYEKDDP